jgi:hypothetical protein
MHLTPALIWNRNLMRHAVILVLIGERQRFTSRIFCSGGGPVDNFRDGSDSRAVTTRHVLLVLAHDEPNKVLFS